MNHLMKIICLNVFTFFLLLTFLTIPSYGIPLVTTNKLLQFGSSGEFQDSFPHLLTEDFEEPSLASGSFSTCTGPIDSSTNQPNCFLPGDILAGITIDAVPGHKLDKIGAGHGLFATTSVTIGADPVSDVLSISFSSSDIHVVGMDLVAIPSGSTYTITVIGESNVILETITFSGVSDSGTFFGIYSVENITKITLDNNSIEVIDNLQFGNIASEVIYYSNQNVFETDHPGLPVEDFEECRIGDTQIQSFPVPLSAETDNALFSAGDILEGLEILNISSTHPSEALRAVGGSYESAGNSTKAIATTERADNLQINFAGFYKDTHAVGMDLMFRQTDDIATIIIYTPTSKILGVASLSLLGTTETFFGIYSKDLIGWIAILNNERWEFVDNIQFGGVIPGVTYYDTIDQFKSLPRSLSLEDFAKSTIADNSTTSCDEPIDASTNQPGCFVPGDIHPNLLIKTEKSLDVSCPSCLRLFGRNMPGIDNSTPLLRGGMPDNLEISFPARSLHSVGISMYGYGIISFYSSGNILVGSTYSPLREGLHFWGVNSTVPLSRITLSYTMALDYILFGKKFHWPFVMPAIIGGDRR